MRKHGRTFYFASFLLGNLRTPILRLYKLCRHMDDLVDNATQPEQAQRQMDSLHQALLRRDTSEPFVAEAINLHQQWRLPLAGLVLLNRSVRSDFPFTQPATEDDLLHYAFGVAGSVGFIMRPMLGCDQFEADRPAVALGIAMQLTNIARDIGEDWKNARVYLPLEWGGFAQEALGRSTKTGFSRLAHQQAIRTLELADNYYSQAEEGIPRLPWRSRWAVRSALAMYRGIGEEIKNIPADQFLFTRAHVGNLRKCFLVLRSILPIRITLIVSRRNSQQWPDHLEKSLQTLYEDQV